MATSSPEPRAALLERIRDGIRKSDEQSAELKKKNSRYVGISIFASALSTVVAGSAATLGPVLGAWKLTCAAVAVCTGVATVFTGLHKQLTIAERLAKATACSGKLHSLDFALTVNNRDTAEVAKEYELALAAYPEILV